MSALRELCWRRQGVKRLAAYRNSVTDLDAPGTYRGNPGYRWQSLCLSRALEARRDSCSRVEAYPDIECEINHA